MRNNPLHLKDSKAGSNQGLLKNIKLYAEIKIKQYIFFTYRLMFQLFGNGSATQ